MRVLCIGNMYPPHHLGGLELVWQSAVRSLRERGHQVRVLTTDHRQAGVGSDEDDDVFRVLRWYWRAHAFPRMSPLSRVSIERANARAFDRHVAAFRPDIVGWWSMGGMSLSLIARAARAGTPSVAFVHDDWLVYGPRVDAWTRMFARRVRFAPLVEHVTGIPTEFDPRAVTIWQFISETTRRRGHAAGWTLPDSEVSPSGIEDLFLKPAPPLPWRWSLLYVGRIDERKGIDTAISALAHLPTQARLNVVGGGDEQEAKRLQRQVAQLGLQNRVVLEGACPRDRLPTVYAGADVVLFPVRWSEPWGLVPLEAMGIGRPVVATGRGGSGEYLDDGYNCLLFDAEDPAGLAAAVRRLHGDAPLRSRLREAGFRTSARFTAARYNDGVERVLLRALRAREVLSSAR